MKLFKTERLPDGSLEKWYSEPNGTIHRELVQNTDKVADAVKAVVDMGAHKSPDRHYLGSVPMVIAKQWAKECGHGIYSREFAEFAKRRLMDGDYAKLSTGLKI